MPPQELQMEKKKQGRPLKGKSPREPRSVRMNVEHIEYLNNLATVKDGWTFGDAANFVLAKGIHRLEDLHAHGIPMEKLLGE
jgi:hypothetical protein